MFETSFNFWYLLVGLILGFLIGTQFEWEEDEEDKDETQKKEEEQHKKKS